VSLIEGAIVYTKFTKVLLNLLYLLFYT